MSDSEDQVHETPASLRSTDGDTGAVLSNSDTITLISNLLDVKLDKKFTAFKKKLDRQESTSQLQFKKLKTESKAVSSFNFKGNRVQYEFNSNLLDIIDDASSSLLEGDLATTNSSIEKAKTLLQKRIKAVRFADKSPAGWAAVEEYESDELADDSEDEKKLRAAEKRALFKLKAKKSVKRPNMQSSFNTNKNKRVASAPADSGVQPPVRPTLRPFQPFRFNRQTAATDKCFQCGQRGHWSYYCPSVGANRFPRPGSTATTTTNN